MCRGERLFHGERFAGVRTALWRESLGWSSKLIDLIEVWGHPCQCHEGGVGTGRDTAFGITPETRSAVALKMAGEAIKHFVRGLGMRALRFHDASECRAEESQRDEVAIRRGQGLPRRSHLEGEAFVQRLRCQFDDRLRDPFAPCRDSNTAGIHESLFDAVGRGAVGEKKPIAVPGSLIAGEPGGIEMCFESIL